MEVGMVMSKGMAAVGPDATLTEAAKLMHDEDVGCVVILDDEQKALGIVTDRDLVIRAVAQQKDFGKVAVSDVMTRNPFTVTIDEPIMLVARELAQREVRRAPVVEDDGTVVGLVSVDDLLTVFITELSNVAATISGASKLVR